MPAHSQANKIWKSIKLLKEWAHHNYSLPYFAYRDPFLIQLFLWKSSVQLWDPWEYMKEPQGSWHRKHKCYRRPGRFPKTSSGAILLILREVSWTQWVELCLPRSGSKNWKLQGLSWRYSRYKLFSLLD